MNRQPNSIMNPISCLSSISDADAAHVVDPETLADLGDRISFTPVRRDRRLRWMRLPRGRVRLLIALAVLALGGAALANSLQSSTRLGAGAVDCSYGTSFNSPGVEGVPISGLSPVAACREQYRRSGPAALARPGVTFVTCQQQSAFQVNVLVADGRPHQCRRLGLSPLPATYAAGAARVDTLERALGALQRGHDCTSPTVLATEVRGVLRRLGFSGWRPELNHPPIFSNGGPCGQFPGTDTLPSDPYLALDPVHRTVMLGTGPALSTDRLIDVVEPLLITDSGRHCLTLAVARALTQRLLVHSHISAKFAVTAEPLGESFNTPRELRYNAGCVIVIGLDPTATGRTMDIWLNARSAPPLPHGQAAPAPSAYSP
jgi:hypothetical protein